MSGYSRAAVIEGTPDELLEASVREWAERWPDEVRRPARAAVSLLRASALVSVRCGEALVPFGLTLARYEALMDVLHAADGERPLGALSLRLELAPATITKVVDGLERAGLVERRPHGSDRRAVVAAITPLGRDVAERATGALAAIEYGLDALAPEGQQRLLAVTRELRGRSVP